MDDSFSKSWRNKSFGDSDDVAQELICDLGFLARERRESRVVVGFGGERVVGERGMRRNRDCSIWVTTLMQLREDDEIRR